MIACLVSWSLLVKNKSRILFLLLAPRYIDANIGHMQIAVRHLPKPYFLMFQRLLFPFANLLFESLDLL